MAVLVLTSTRFGEHTPPPGHPERPERQDVMDAVAARWRELGGLVAEPAPASRDAILRVHSERFVQTLESAAGQSVGRLSSQLSLWTSCTKTRPVEPSARVTWR